MKLNCKGFIMLETIIVASFVIGIFTFLYFTVVPLLGKYENLIDKNSIDDVYRIYHIRQLYYQDPSNFNNSNGKLTCESPSKCESLLNTHLKLENYEIFNIEKNGDYKNSSIDADVKDYINKLSNGKYLILYNKDNEDIIHLSYVRFK